MKMRTILVIAAFALSLPCLGQSVPSAVATASAALGPGSPAASILPKQPALSLSVESMAPLKIESATPNPWWSFWIPVVGPIVSGLLAFLGVWQGLKFAAGNTSKTLEVTRSTSETAVWQKSNEAELNSIQKKLDDFYIPFKLLSKANKLISDDLRLRQREGYRLLIWLFDQEWRNGLSAGDAKLVEIVCKNAEELRALIVSKSGLVDESLLEYLSRVNVHFRMLHLAYNNELGSDSGRFSQYVYPRKLDGVLELEIERLRARMSLLRSKPGIGHESMGPLVIPEKFQLEQWGDLPSH